MKKELINKTITYRMGVCFQSFEYCDNIELAIIECSTIPANSCQQLILKKFKKHVTLKWAY